MERVDGSCSQRSQQSSRQPARVWRRDSLLLCRHGCLRHSRQCLHADGRHFPGRTGLPRPAQGDRLPWSMNRWEMMESHCASGRVLSTGFYNNGKSHQGHVVPGNRQRRAPTTRWTARACARPYLELSRGVLAHPATVFHASPPSETGALIWAPTLQLPPARAPRGAPWATASCPLPACKNGCGNMIFVDHASQHTTVICAHLGHGVPSAASAWIGRSCGAVGSTGWATGPHLHFEFRDRATA